MTQESISNFSDRLISRKKAAELLGVSYATLKDWAIRRDYALLPVVRIGPNRAHYLLSDVRALAEARKNKIQPKEREEIKPQNFHTITLSRAEAAAILGLSERALSNWAYRKVYSLPFFKVGKFARYRLSDLLTFIEANRITQKNGDYNTCKNTMENI